MLYRKRRVNNLVWHVRLWDLDGFMHNLNCWNFRLHGHGDINRPGLFCNM